MSGQGFTLCIDEAGDDGLERVRPIDPDGASEYFLMAGVIFSQQRQKEIDEFVDTIKSKIGIELNRSLHFRDLNDHQKNIVIEEIAKFKIGIVCVVSNKRNMRNYRNRRIEDRISMAHNGRTVTPRYNWFYNSIFRYLIESASIKCAEIGSKFKYSNYRIKVIFSYRRGFSYSQTRNYLRKLEIEQRPRSYFNSKRRPRFDAIDIGSLAAMRSHQHPGLQIADCVASAMYQAIDDTNFREIKPQYILKLKPKFIDIDGVIKGFGFKLLPDDFRGPISDRQKEALRAVGYRF